MTILAAVKRLVPLALGAMVLLAGTACSGEGEARVQAVTPAPSSAAPASSPSPVAAPATASARAATTCARDAEPGDRIETVTTPEGARNYRLHVPPAADRPLPLVVNYHGYDRTAEQQETYSGLVPLADREGFVLVTPEGGGDPQAWEVPGIDDTTGLDDVAVTAALVAKVEGELCIDPARVYATGMSNGAEMASLAGCELPGVFAAVAPVAGVVFPDCTGGPVAVIAFHGTEDFNVPFDTAPPAIEDWAEHNGCAPEPAQSQVSEHVSLQRFGGCEADVELYVVDGGGHTWPGAPDDSGGAGPTTHEISAAELIWAFFAAHPKR